MLTIILPRAPAERVGALYALGFMIRGLCGPHTAKSAENTALVRDTLRTLRQREGLTDTEWEDLTRGLPKALIERIHADETTRHMTDAEVVFETKALDGVSATARAVYLRLLNGRWYGMENAPKAMEELVDAGLVVTAGRIKVMERAYVPAIGFVPFANETWARSPIQPATGE